MPYLIWDPFKATGIHLYHFTNIFHAWPARMSLTFIQSMNLFFIFILEIFTFCFFNLLLQFLLHHLFCLLSYLGGKEYFLPCLPISLYRKISRLMVLREQFEVMATLFLFPFSSTSFLIVLYFNSSFIVSITCLMIRPPDE